jgi:hypothetical protein
MERYPCVCRYASSCITVKFSNTVSPPLHVLGINSCIPPIFLHLIITVPSIYPIKLTLYNLLNLVSSKHRFSLNNSHSFRQRNIIASEDCLSISRSLLLCPVTLPPSPPLLFLSSSPPLRQVRPRSLNATPPGSVYLEPQKFPVNKTNVSFFQLIYTFIIP